MAVTIETLGVREMPWNQYAYDFLRRTGDMRRLQALLAGHLPNREVIRLAEYEHELRHRKQ